jgi:hypothetical protein
MPTLTGTVRAARQPAGWAYVQVRNLAGDFQGEVRADADGRFTLYPQPGQWRPVAWRRGSAGPSATSTWPTSTSTCPANRSAMAVEQTDQTVVLTHPAAGRAPGRRMRAPSRDPSGCRRSR